MHIVEKNLKKAEMRYENEKTGENALGLFACYILAGKTIGDEAAYLSKAFHTAVTAHHEDLLDIRLITSVLYANVLLENYENAYELVKAIDVNSAFLSKNMPLYYGQMLYFYSIIQCKTEKVRSAKKIQRSLEILYEKTELPQLLGYLASLQRILFEDTGLCAEMLLEALSKGVNSIFLYLEIYETLMLETEYSKELSELSRTVIPWALNKDIPIGPILERVEKRTLISILFTLSVNHLAKIFKTYKLFGAFQCLCQKLISKGDTSKEALSYYVTALEHELSLRGLSQTAVNAAYINHYSDLPITVIEAALIQSTGYTPGLLAFLFNILITRKDAFIALEKHEEIIVKFGFWAHSKGYRGKNFNTIYKYLHELYPNDEGLLNTLSEELFKYDIQFKGKPPSFVCSSEYAKSGTDTYSVSGDVCRISTLGDFELYFLGEDETEYLSIADYTVSKSLEEPDLALMETLYERGGQAPLLLLALSREYLSKTDFDKKQISVLQKAAGLREISDSFKEDICTALAGFYSKKGQYAIAIHYYSYLGEYNIKPGYIAGAINAYIAAGKYDSALSLISRQHHLVEDKVIFNALNLLYEKADSLEIATICRNLILKDLCSQEILSILLRKYKGTIGEWLEITNKIDSLGFDAAQLYEKIIVNGIFIGHISDECNEAFIKLYRKNKDHPIILKYAYFCCYEIIRNDKTISITLAETLEDLYFEKGEDKLLCIALAITCINNERLDKGYIIGEAAMYLEEYGIILDKFKEFQNKSFISSYIEKNTPFTHYQTSHKNISICYKTEDMSAYLKKPLKYFKFGIYLVNLPLFYGEKMSYYFEEENGQRTELRHYVNNHMRIVEQFNDPFYTINNLVIYEHMMKFDLAEELIEAEILNNEQVSVIIL